MTDATHKPSLACGKDPALLAQRVCMLIDRYKADRTLLDDAVNWVRVVPISIQRRTEVWSRAPNRLPEYDAVVICPASPECKLRSRLAELLRPEFPNVEVECEW